MELGQRARLLALRLLGRRRLGLLLLANPLNLLLFQHAFCALDDGPRSRRSVKIFCRRASAPALLGCSNCPAADMEPVRPRPAPVRPRFPCAARERLE